MTASPGLHRLPPVEHPGLFDNAHNRAAHVVFFRPGRSPGICAVSPPMRTQWFSTQARAKPFDDLCEHPGPEACPCPGSPQEEQRLGAKHRNVVDAMIHEILPRWCRGCPSRTRSSISCRRRPRWKPAPARDTSGCRARRGRRIRPPCPAPRGRCVPASNFGSVALTSFPKSISTPAPGVSFLFHAQED